MKKKSVVFLLILSCLSVNLGACSGGSSREVDYNLDSSEEGAAVSLKDGQESEVGATLAQFAKEEDWVESFSVTRENGEEVSIQIDGEIRIPSADHMSVIEVKAPSEEDFDFSVMEEMAYPVTKSIYDSSQDEEFSWIHDMRQFSFSIAQENNGTLHVPEERRNEFLRFVSTGNEPSEDNLCSYSMEEAEELAADFLEKLGISVSEYQIEEHCGVMWGDHPYGQEYFMEDGHYISYVLKDDLGNDLITSLEKYVNLNSMYSGTTYEFNPEIKILLLDKGILEVHLYNPVQVIGSTPVTKYASFDTVKEKLRTTLLEEFDKVYIPRDAYFDTQEELIINSIELIYFRIKNKEKEDCYSYIPVWLFCHHTETGGEIIDDTVYNPILINALDGSVIYLEEEL